MSMHTADRQRVKQLLLGQLLVTLLVTAGAGLAGSNAALSAGLGGLASLIPNALFALGVFAQYRAQEAGRLVARFYLAELLKLLLTALIFVAVFVWVKPVNVAALFLAFFAVQVLSPLLTHGLASKF